MKDFLSGKDEQMKSLAEVIQINRPDVINLQEFDYNSRGEYSKLFRKNYLEWSRAYRI